MSEVATGAVTRVEAVATKKPRLEAMTQVASKHTHTLPGCQTSRPDSQTDSLAELFQEPRTSAERLQQNWIRPRWIESRRTEHARQMLGAVTLRSAKEALWNRSHPPCESRQRIDIYVESVDAANGFCGDVQRNIDRGNNAKLPTTQEQYGTNGDFDPICQKHPQ